MTTPMPCSNCETTRDIEVVERKETVTIKGKEVCYTARFSRCTFCGDEFDTAGQMDANLDASREAYACLYEAPSPDQLRALRERFGASQKAFGTILGFGELTMNSYEQGNSPDSANRLLLKLAADPYIFKAMYEINSNRIGATQRRRIEESEGYRSASKWSGLSALDPLLTQHDKDKIETDALRYERSVPIHIAVQIAPLTFPDCGFKDNEAIWLDQKSAKLSKSQAEQLYMNTYLA